jgi:hypothetical protein
LQDAHLGIINIEWPLSLEIQMTTTVKHKNNVIALRTATETAREQAHAEIMVAERALQDNAEKFHSVIKRALRTAISSGSHIFAPYNEALAAANRAEKDALERLRLATRLFGKQLDALDHAKSEHETFVKAVKAQTEADTIHQFDLQRANRIGHEILAGKKQLRLQRDRHSVRLNIMQIENPLAWALYRKKSTDKEGSGTTLFQRVGSKVSAWLKETKTFKSATVAVGKLDEQITERTNVLAALNADLNRVHEDIFRVRNDALQKISKSHLSVENAQKDFSAAEALKDTVVRELAIAKQTLSSLQTFDHPVAEKALELFTDAVMTASRGGGNGDAILFLMGSKRLADDLISTIRASDSEEYDLIAELHYSKEAEAMIQQSAVIEFMATAAR